MLRRLVRTIAAGGVAAAILACGGSSDGGTGPTPVFTSVLVSPSAPHVAVGSTTTLTDTARDQNGAVFAGATGATWSSATTSVATVTPATGVVSGIASGTSVITASITVGSITHTGVQTVTVTPSTPPPSASGDVTATTTLHFDPSTVTVLAPLPNSATVTWHFQSVAHTVTWDAHPGRMTDIPATSNASVSRAFIAQGTYTYHCAIHPSMSGTVIVQ